MKKSELTIFCEISHETHILPIFSTSHRRRILAFLLYILRKKKFISELFDVTLI